MCVCVCVHCVYVCVIMTKAISWCIIYIFLVNVILLSCYIKKGWTWLMTILIDARICSFLIFFLKSGFMYVMSRYVCIHSQET